MITIAGFSVQGSEVRPETCLVPAWPGMGFVFRKRMKAVNPSKMKSKLPEFLFHFFWEYDPTTIDLADHADLIMNRLMSRGTWEAMIWLKKNYSRTQIVSFLRRQGRKRLPPRELNYWAFICGVPPDTRKLWIAESRKSPHVWRDVHTH